jgi:hypothetical protein
MSFKRFIPDVLWDGIVRPFILPALIGGGVMHGRSCETVLAPSLSSYSGQWQQRYS